MAAARTPARVRCRQLSEHTARARRRSRTSDLPIGPSLLRAASALPASGQIGDADADDAIGSVWVGGRPAQGEGTAHGVRADSDRTVAEFVSDQVVEGVDVSGGGEVGAMFVERTAEAEEVGDDHAMPCPEQRGCGSEDVTGGDEAVE